MPPWPIPPARTARAPLEIEASLLDSDVQGLLGTEANRCGRASKWPAASVGYSYEYPSREVVRAQLLPDSPDSGWGWRHFCSACKSSGCSRLTDAGRRGRHSLYRWTVRSCTSFRFLRGGAHRDCCRSRGPAGNCLHMPSLVRTAHGTRRVLSTHDPAEEEQISPSLPAKAWSAKKAAKCPARSRIAAPPPKRQCHAGFQATVLAHGRCRWKVDRPRCWGIPAVLSKTSSPALHEARTLLAARAGASRIRLPVKSVRLAKLAAVLDKPPNSR